MPGISFLSPMLFSLFFFSFFFFLPTVHSCTHAADVVKVLLSQSGVDITRSRYE